MKRNAKHRFVAALMAGALVFTACDWPASDVVYAGDSDANAETIAETLETTAEAVSGTQDINFDFEDGTKGWTTTGQTSVPETGAKSGSKYLHLDAGATATITITDIAQGSYTLSAYVKGTQNSKNDAKISISETGGPDTETLLNTYLSSDWTEIGNRNILDYNGQMQITITAGSCSVDIDKLELTCDSADSNTLSNWNFEQGLSGWTTAGTVTETTEDADTGSKAVKLADQSEISQVISVEPNTKYSVTMRAKVDDQDEFKTIYATSYRGKTGETQERTSLGDRVNLGVRGVADDVVYRQAPAGTEGYALVSITFTTGNVNEVEVYANTIYDTNYTDSVTLYNTDGTYLADEWKSNGEDFAYVDNFDVFQINDDNNLRGADISFLPAIEDLGGNYYANGVQQDCLRILSNHGVNSVLTMIMVEAGAPTHSTKTGEVLNQLQGQNWNLLKEDGSVYEYAMIQGGYFDKEHCVEIGKRATALGMSYVPSFHFSDTWISAAKAYTPECWLNTDYDGNYSNSDIAHIQTAVYNYVYDFMTDLKEANVNVAAVKNGNEQNGGLIWPVGSGATSANHAAIVAAAYDAETDAMAGVSGWVHTNNGYDTSSANSFFNGLLTSGAKFDGNVFSLYGGRSTGNIVTMANYLNSDENLKYNDFVEVETGMTFTSYSPTVDTANSKMYISSYYQMTPNGQYNWLLDYMQALLDSENPYGQTRGFYYWETDWIPTPGAGSSDGSSSDVNQRIMFNNGDTSIHEMGSTQNGRAGDMMDSMYAYLMRGCVKAKSKDMLTPSSTGSEAYEVVVEDPTSITLKNTDIKLSVGEQERLKPTISTKTKGAVSTDSSVEYTSSDESVCQIKGNGFVVAVGAGTATITAKVGDCSTTAKVTVGNATKSSSISVTIDGKAATDTQTEIYSKLQLDATVSEDATCGTVVYKSSNPDVAAFFGDTWQTEDGVMYQEAEKDTKVQLNCNGAGSSTITVSTLDGSQTTSFVVTVTKVDAQSVTVSPAEVNLSCTRTTNLSATVLPENTSKYHISWVSEDTSIATVDQNGKVTGKTVGDVVIKAVSDDNVEVYGTCTVHVIPVQVESVTLDREKMTLQLDTTKTVNALVLPEDANNKKVNWTSADPAIASVDENGNVTGISVGETTITATTDNKGLTATCTVKVQKDAVPVTGVEISDSEYYFSSDYFSDTNQDADAPVYRMSATVLPTDATNDTVVWASDNEAVATVDNFGRVTAVSSGVAKITATTKEGNYVATSIVYVPEISESFDNRDDGDTWATKACHIYAGTLGATVAEASDGNKYLSITGGGSGGRGIQKQFTNAVTSDKVVVDFDWQAGALSNSPCAYVFISDSSNNSYLTIQETSATGELTYGSNATADGNVFSSFSQVGTGFNVSGAWYHIHAVIDQTNKETTFTMTSLSDSTVTATHTVAFADGVTYSESVNAIQLWAQRKGGTMSWTTGLDNVNVYDAIPKATSITASANAVKIIPVKNTLMASKQLSASVLPASADQTIIWTSSDESVATVDESGLVTPAKTYRKLASVVSGTCTITATSKSNSNVKVEIPVTVTNSINASEFFNVKDEDGNIVYGGDTAKTVEMETQETKTLIPVLTGGDGDTDIAGITWSSSDEKILTVDASTGLMKAKKHGNVVVKLVVKLYAGDDLTAEIPVSISGTNFVELDDLKLEIETAQTDKKYDDDYYTSDSLKAYTDALTKAKADVETAKSEGWTDEKQDDIDSDLTALKSAVSGLKKAASIAIKSIKLSETAYPISVGKTARLSYTVAPTYATEDYTFTSSDESIATVTAHGTVIGKAAGTATITVASESGAVKESIKVTVTSDLTSYYDNNGVTITATNTSSKYKAVNPFIQARTMAISGGTVWSTGANDKMGTIVVDLGSKAKVTDVQTAFWEYMCYTIDVSDDGTTWTSVVDHTDEAAGVLSTASEPYKDQLPEDTYTRYIRLNITKNAGSGWVGVTVMQVNGAFTAPDDCVDKVENLEATLPAGCQLASTDLPETTAYTTAKGQSGQADVTWDEDSFKKAVAQGIGVYTIPGTATIDGMTFALSCNLTIEAVDMSKATITLDKTSYDYNFDECEPNVTVSYDGFVLDEDNYYVNYENNDCVGTAKVIVTGINLAVGTASCKFTINKAKIANAKVTLDTYEYTYDGTAKNPAVVVTFEGEVLSNGVDYTLSYVNNMAAGQAQVVVTGIGDFEGSQSVAYTIKKASGEEDSTKDDSAKGDTKDSSNTSDNQSGEATKSDEGTAASGAASDSGNQSPSTKQTADTSKPASTKLLKVKNSKKGKLTIKWKKSSSVSGYQIAYGTKKSFAGASKKIIKGAKNISKTVSVKKGKTYYVRVRTYKTVDGKKVYSSWSKSLKVKIKK